MAQKKRFWILGLGIPLTLVLAYGPINKMGKVPAGYKAKVACSEIFVAGRNADDVISTNFDNISPTFDWVKLDVNEVEKSVQGKFLGVGKSKALFRNGAGCSLVGKNGLTAVTIPSPQNTDGHLYETAIRADVQNALQPFFDDEALPNPIVTRGIVVIQNDQIIAEQYAEGFDAKTRQQSWSTAKGFTQALIGIAQNQGHLSLEDKVELSAWSDDDPRGQITLGHLLHMASGLEFSEAYANPNSHVDQMLFNQSDMGAYAASLKLAHKPGTVSQYSSGTTNIVASMLRAKLEANGVDYHSFPRKELFDKLSMSSAIFEVDAVGTFIGSSYIYATPRDFARFGQLYLQKGQWKGEQILSPEWIDYTRQPAPQSGGKYGSHWSLNLGQKTLPGLPEDVIHLGGNDGQMIVVIPSKNTVIVRLGVTRWPATLENDLYPLIRNLYDNI